MVATNAGGLHVVRYGAMRAQVVGVEAVLGTGQVVSRLAGLVKDNTGYDLAQLLCGSEGTLGIVTAARLRLVPPPAHVVTALVGVASVETPCAGRRAAPGAARRQALELMTADSLRLVAEHLDATPPVAARRGRLPAGRGGAPAADPLDAWPAPSRRPTACSTPRSPTDAAERAGLWRWREAHSEAGARWGSSTSSTSRCRPASWPVLRRGGRPGRGGPPRGRIRCCSATSATATSTSTWSARRPTTRRSTTWCSGLVVERGGAISAEHGIGTLKRRWLARDRSPGEVAAMRGDQGALDPDGILNPGVLLPRARAQRTCVEDGLPPRPRRG